MAKSLSSREIIRTLKDAGWREVRVTGSHHHFRHPSRPGTVTVPHPVKAARNASQHRAAERRKVEVSTMQRFYTAIIEKAKDGFGVFFPDLPGCTSFGKTVENAAANAYTAAQAHVALSREYGDTIPDPRAPDAIPAERGVKEKARLLIPVEMADEPVRVNISLPATALEALDRTAKELSLSRSGAIAYLALERDSKTGQFVSPPGKASKKRAKVG